MTKNRRQVARARQIRRARQKPASETKRPAPRRSASAKPSATSDSARPSARQAPARNRAAWRRLSPMVWGGIALLIVLIVAATFYFAVLRPTQEREQVQVVEETEMTPAMQWTQAPAMALVSGVDYAAILHTDKGEIHIDLFEQETPITVNNFVFLARQGFYNGVTFHRVLANFMAQTGDPTGTGAGGPGYRFQDEFVPTLRHDSEGIVSMANAGRNTNGSQFFITFAPTPHLNDAHTVFGRVTQGMDVVRALRLRNPATDRQAPPGDRIVTVEIIEQ